MPSKSPSIISTIITIILLLLFGAFSLFVSLVALNGYSGRAGDAALAVILICNGVGILLSSILAWTMPRWLISKFNWNTAVAVAVTVLAGFFLGGGASILSIFAGILTADTVWNAR